MIVLNDKFKPLFNSTSRYFIITGGRGSSKSFALNSFASLLSYEANTKILFTRHTMTSAHISIIPEFKEKIELMQREQDFLINKTEIYNRLSGSEILFRGIKTSSGDQTANLKSLQGITDWIVDEAEELTNENTFDKINLSIRSNKKQNRVILILNPSTKEHWIYKKFFEEKGISEGFNGTIGDTTYIHTTYLDNIKHLPESFVNEIEQMKVKHPTKYNHQILGGWLDKAEGVIFTNWSIGKFENVGTSVFGQDFGFSNDPTTLVETSIDKANKKIYCKLHYHKTHLTTSDILQLNTNYANRNLIVADSAEPRLIAELQTKLNIVGAVKGPDSVIYGISLLQDYELIIDPESIEMIKELNNYCWLERKSKTPIDMYNHCFVGETMITTNKGDVRIDSIKIGDYVLTSKGFKKVLKTFNNGVKQVNKYSMQFDTFSVSLCSTKEHKIKTTKEWKKISELSKEDVLYQYKYSTEKNINCTMVKGILVEVQKDFMLKFGNSTMEKLKKDTMFTMLTAIHKITILKILILLVQLYTLGMKVKKGLKKIQTSLKNFMLKVLKKQKNGTNQKKVENGMLNMAKKCGLINLCLKRIVQYAEKNTKQDIQEYQNTVIKTAKLKHLEVGENYQAQVYDLMIEDCHEYFANGILVHNCLDALRYAVSYQLSGGLSSKVYVY